MSGAGGGRSRLESEMVSNTKFALFITAVMFAAMGIGFTIYFLAYMRWSFFLLVNLGMISSTCFLLSAFSVYRLLTMDKKAEREAVYGPYVCKHCWRRFMKKKEWKTHERSCVEMKL